MASKKLSLQEQLLQAGLASAAKAKEIKASKHKEAKLQRHNQVSVVNEAAVQMQKAKAEQLAKDLELSALQKQQAEQKAVAAQIKQLIESGRKPQYPDGLAYHFTDNGKIKTVYVDEQLRKQLIKGHIAVVKFEQQYDLVTVEVAEKIRLRDSTSVILLNKIDAAPADDPYAAYQVPDDLMW